jgi:hypothetical protein
LLDKEGAYASRAQTKSTEVGYVLFHEQLGTKNNRRRKMKEDKEKTEEKGR